MKTKKIIVNRMSDWYSITSTNSDPFYLAMTLLEKLSTRTKIGIYYDRYSISKEVSQQANEEVVKTIDKAIVLLLSRQLITIEQRKVSKIIMITEAGFIALDRFKEEIAHVD